MRSKIFLVLLLITPGILGIPTPLETDDSNDFLPVSESSVDNEQVANGVSKTIEQCKLRECMHAH